MTTSNGSDRLSRLEDLVLSLAQTFSQATQQQQTFNQQINERLSEFIEQSNENFRTIAEAHRVTEHQIGELAESQRLTNDSVQTLVSTVGVLAEQVHEMQSEVRGLQTENRRILDRLFGEQNGGQPE